jgi:hypothetical protein
MTDSTSQPHIVHPHYQYQNDLHQTPTTTATESRPSPQLYQQPAYAMVRCIYK